MKYPEERKPRKSKKGRVREGQIRHEKRKAEHRRIRKEWKKFWKWETQYKRAKWKNPRNAPSRPPKKLAKLSCIIHAMTRK